MSEQRRPGGAVRSAVDAVPLGSEVSGRVLLLPPAAAASTQEALTCRSLAGWASPAAGVDTETSALAR